MSKLNLGHTLETILKDGEKQLAPLLKEGEARLETLAKQAETKLGPLVKDAGKLLGTVTKEVFEGVIVDRIEKEIDALTGSSEKPAQHAAGPNAHPHDTHAHNVHQGHPTNVPVPASATPLTGFGSTGPSVRELQRDLGVPVDGIDGPQTTAALKAFQSAHGLRPDGIAGPQTWPVLRAEPSVHEGSQGDAVRRIQGQLGVRVDGIDGPQTTAAIKSFQTDHGLTPDGIVGIHTWKALDTAAEAAKANPNPTLAPPAHPPAAVNSPPLIASHADGSSTAPATPPQAGPSLTPPPQPASPPALTPHPHPGSSPALTPHPQPGSSPALHLPPLANEPALSMQTLELKAGQGLTAVYNGLVGDDLKIIANPKAPLLERVLAGADLATDVIDPPKAIAETAIKLGVKEGLKGAAEVAIATAVETAARTATSAPAASSMHVRYGGEDRPIGDGYRQSGKILSVQDGIVTQSTGRSTAEYKLSELTAEARDPAAVEKLLVPGSNVQISVESHALQVTSLDQHHERDRIQTQAR